MFSDYIRIAVSHILSEYDNGRQRCCASCNPSCNDLTRFICFGHTIDEIEEWIQNNNDILYNEHQKYLDSFDCLENSNSNFYVSDSGDTPTISLDKLKEFCKECPKFIEVRDKALANCESVFDAASEVENFQLKCVKSCEKFAELN